jgi:arginine-tRNA-protein transferase
MVILQEKELTTLEQCPYLKDERQRLEYFYAIDVTAEELDELLEEGWRKFGVYFFRPDCPGCNKCISIRIPVKSFSPSKSQRRIFRKNAQTEAAFSPLHFDEEIFDIYCEHSRARFGMDVSFEDFISAYYIPSCPSIQSEYRADGRLFAAGFLDVSTRGLSSVYFVYRPDYSRLRPGIFSILREICYAAALGLEYYYLGYWVEGNPRMEYKNSLAGGEKHDRERGVWSAESFF